MTQPYYPRPREKLATSSAQKLTDHELLQAIIGSGTRTIQVKNVARSVMRLFRKSDGLLTYAELCAIPGLGSAYASRIIAAFELTRRWQSLLYTPQTFVPMRTLLNRNSGVGSATVICDLYNAAHEVVDRLSLPLHTDQTPSALIRSILVQTAPTQAVIVHVGIVGDRTIRENYFSDLLFAESLKATLAFIDVSLQHLSIVDRSGEVTEVSF